MLGFRLRLGRFSQILGKPYIGSICLTLDDNTIKLLAETRPMFELDINEEHFFKNSIHDEYVTIAYADLVSGKGWKVDNGTLIFEVDVIDTDFMNQVEAGEIRFAKNDIWFMRIITRQRLVAGRLMTEYSAIGVAPALFLDSK